MPTRTPIPKPDVEVTITTRSVTPTVVTPALPACIVGPCYFTLDPQLSTGLVANPDALLELPAMIRGAAQPVNAAVNAGETVRITINANGTSVSADFAGGIPGATFTPTQVVAALNAALVAASASVIFELEGTGASQRFVGKTTGTGPAQYLIWAVTDVAGTSSANFLSGLKFPLSWRANGSSSYDQLRRVFAYDEYPDPLDLDDEIDIQVSTVAVYGNLSAGLAALSKTDVVSRCGVCQIDYIDDGDADGYTPLVTFTNGAGPLAAIPSDLYTQLLTGVPADANLVNLTAVSGQASHVGAGVFTAPAADRVLSLGINGLEHQHITITSVDDDDTVVAKINRCFPDIATTSFPGVGAGTITLDLSTFNANVAALFGTHGRDSVLYIYGTAVDEPATHNDYVFNAGNPYAGPSGGVRVVRGAWHPIRPQDGLWIQGAFKGYAVEVSMVGAVGRVRLDREWAVAASGADAVPFYFTSRNLVPTIVGDANLPIPNLVVSTGSAPANESEGRVQLGMEWMRNALNGTPNVYPFSSTSPQADLYMGYTGLRLDVTPLASDADLLNYTSATELATDMGSIDTSNPLALGMYFALVNCPGMAVYGLGVDAVSTTEPDGTKLAYDTALEFLESKSVYSLVPLTHSEDVHDAFQVHVDALSTPTMKSERVVWINPSLPTRERSTIIASGTKGNSTTAAFPHSFNTGIADLAARFIAAGITPGVFVSDTDRIYLQVASQGSKMWAVTNVVGSVLTITAYVGTAGLPFETVVGTWTTALIDEPFSIGKLGASLYTGTVYNKTKASEALYDIGQHYADRRVRMVVPDEVTVTIGGLESLVPGYYGCSALAGMRAYNSPSQGFTNMTVGGLDNVQRTQGFFSESQLNVIAGGGGWILIPSPGATGVITRMSLTTDVSSIQYRQESFTGALDYTSIYLREALRRIIGPVNITQQTLDMVSTIITSALEFLIRAGVLVDASIESLAQSTSQPDSIDVTIDAQVPLNLMYIRLVVVV